MHILFNTTFYLSHAGYAVRILQFEAPGPEFH